METVSSQDLCSADDRTLIEICRVEGRALISLDKGFANTIAFPPKRYAGIVVLRLPEPLTVETIDGALSRVVIAGARTDLRGRLWVVDSNRIREFSEPDLP